jgi:NAD(P)-dependent dehydrogenase (short-subunit alcohol dehydrogenase family)
MKRVAVVTGANRGLGFETAKELAQKDYTVVLTARDAEKGKSAAEKLRAQKFDAHFHPLDVTVPQSIKTFRTWIEKEFGRLDVLVNNAGIMLDGDEENTSAFAESTDLIRRTMETNVYGPYQLCQQLIPLMEKNGYGRVVNLSSGMGQLSEMNGNYPAYRISKTAINAVTRIFADETQGKNILVNSVCPGWVKTDMGGPGAERSLPEGADTIVWLATLPDGSPTGGFFRDRNPISW